MGMDVRTLQNYKIFADMIPELDDLVTFGMLTKTTNPYNLSSSLILKPIFLVVPILKSIVTTFLIERFF